MEFVTDLLTYIPATVRAYAAPALAFLAAAGLISVLVQLVKKHRGWDELEKRGKRYIVGFLGLTSLLVASAETFIQYGDVLSPIPHIGTLATSLMGGAMLLHRFFTSPAWYKLESFLGGLVSDVRAVRQARDVTVQPVTAPVEPVPPRFVT